MNLKDFALAQLHLQGLNLHRRMSKALTNGVIKILLFPTINFLDKSFLNLSLIKIMNKSINLSPIFLFLE